MGRTYYRVGCDGDSQFRDSGGDLNCGASGDYACRAYFQLNGLTADDADASRIVLNFGDNEESGITTTNYTNGTNHKDAWYDLNGRPLSRKSSQKGIYINNRKKVVIKH